ncbi:hypothetical protein BC831DRAFT_551577 [Entophlyctis helioformis]|nr:hypothetical protein BC831DRAFT_551577 [Entophlyctis helioformis]
MLLAASIGRPGSRACCTTRQQKGRRCRENACERECQVATWSPADQAQRMRILASASQSATSGHIDGRASKAATRQTLRPPLAPPAAATTMTSTLNQHNHHQHQQSQTHEPGTPDSAFSVTAGLVRSQPPSSLWHAAHISLVDALSTASADASAASGGLDNSSKGTSLKQHAQARTDGADPANMPTVSLQHRLLHELLPIVVSQFPCSPDQHVQAPTAGPPPTASASGQYRNHGPLSAHAQTMHPTSSSRSVQAARSVVTAINYSLCLESAWHRDADKKVAALKTSILNNRQHSRASAAFDGIVSDSDVVHDRKIRMLLLTLLVTLCRRMDRAKFVSVFSTPVLRHVPDQASTSWSMATIVDTLCQAFISIVDSCRLLAHIAALQHHGSLGQGSAVPLLSTQPSRSFAIWDMPMALRARDCLRDFLLVLRNNIGVYDQVKDQQALQIAEVFMRRLFKQLALVDRHPLFPEQIQAIVSIYGDCVHLVPSSFHSHMPSKHIHVFSHPLLLVQHPVLRIVRLALWNGLRLARHASAVLRKMAKSIRKYSQERADASAYPMALVADSTTLAESSSFADAIASVLGAETAHMSAAAAQNGSVSQPGITSASSAVDKDAQEVMCLHAASADILVKWATRCSYHRLVRLFLLPLVGQLAASESNWSVCESLLLRLLGDDPASSDRERSPIDSSAVNPWLRESILKWLVSVACHRTPAGLGSSQASHDHSVRLFKLPSTAAAMNVRIFAVRALGAAASCTSQADRSTISCLISLFDDTSYQIRMHVASVMAVVGLNFPNVGDGTRAMCRHFIEGGCQWLLNMSSDDAGSKCAPGKLRIPSPYSFFLVYLDQCLLLDGGITASGSPESPDASCQSPSKQQLSSWRERETLGLWSYHITRHIWFLCPVFGGQSGSSARTDVRHRAVSWLMDELVKRLSRLQGASNQEPGGKVAPPVMHQSGLAADIDGSILQRQMIASIVSGVLEGSWMLSDVMASGKRPSPPLCDEAVLRACAPVLFRLRRDPSVAIRILCVETCGRLLGATVHVKGRPAGLAAPVMWSDPDLSSLPVLAMLYKIVQGEYPNLSAGSASACKGGQNEGRSRPYMHSKEPTLSTRFIPQDSFDRDSQLTSLCQAIVSHGQRYHLLAFYVADAGVGHADGARMQEKEESATATRDPSAVPLAQVPIGNSHANAHISVAQPPVSCPVTTAQQVPEAESIAASTVPPQRPSANDGSSKSCNPPDQSLRGLKSDRQSSLQPAFTPTVGSRFDSTMPAVHETVITIDMDDEFEEAADADAIRAIYADLEHRMQISTQTQPMPLQSPQLDAIPPQPSAKAVTFDPRIDRPMLPPAPSTGVSAMQSPHQVSFAGTTSTSRPEHALGRISSFADAELAKARAFLDEAFASLQHLDVEASTLGVGAVETAAHDRPSANAGTSEGDTTLAINAIVSQHRAKLDELEAEFKFEQVVPQDMFLMPSASLHHVSGVQTELSVPTHAARQADSEAQEGLPIAADTSVDELLSQRLKLSLHRLSGAVADLVSGLSPTDRQGPFIPDVLQEIAADSVADADSCKDNNSNNGAKAVREPKIPPVPLYSLGPAGSSTVAPGNPGVTSVSGRRTVQPALDSLPQPGAVHDEAMVVEELQSAEDRTPDAFAMLNGATPFSGPLIRQLDQQQQQSSPQLENRHSHIQSTGGQRPDAPYLPLLGGPPSPIPVVEMDHDDVGDMDEESRDGNAASQPVHDQATEQQLLAADSDRQPIGPMQAVPRTTINPEPSADVSTATFGGPSLIVQSTETLPNPFVRSRLFEAVELVLRHLVFDRRQKQTIDYQDMYGDGLVYGSMRNLALLPERPVAPSAKGRTRRRSAESGSDSAGSIVVLREALHPVLKEVFRLDQSLFLLACEDMTLTSTSGAETSLADSWLRPAPDTAAHHALWGGPSTTKVGNQLSQWLHGLSLVHEHLLPLSRTLFKVEQQMQASVSIAQALVILRDQLAFSVSIRVKTPSYLPDPIETKTPKARRHHQLILYNQWTLKPAIATSTMSGRTSSSKAAQAHVSAPALASHPSAAELASSSSNAANTSSNSNTSSSAKGKTTIHVTNITKDKASLKRLFERMPGFCRIAFHADYVFVCFNDLHSATLAIGDIQRRTDMLAAYAKNGITAHALPSIAVPPNPILYVSVYPFITEAEMTGIFSLYDGFDSCRFFATHALVRFKSVEHARKALDNLNSTTNLFANFSNKGAKGGVVTDEDVAAMEAASNTAHGRSDNAAQRAGRGEDRREDTARATASASASAATAGQTARSRRRRGGVGNTTTASGNANGGGRSRGDSDTGQSSPRARSPTSAASTNAGTLCSTRPKRTLHVTSIETDKAGIYQMLLQYNGFTKVAFYPDYCFVCFSDVVTAGEALEDILFNTRMKASYARADFTCNTVAQAALGQLNTIIRVSDYPSTSTKTDLQPFFALFDGFHDMQVYQASCLVYFDSFAQATAALNEINARTNFTAVYSKKGVASTSTAQSKSANQASAKPPLARSNISAVPNAASSAQQLAKAKAAGKPSLAASCAAQGSERGSNATIKATPSSAVPASPRDATLTASACRLPTPSDAGKELGSDSSSVADSDTESDYTDSQSSTPAPGTPTPSAVPVLAPTPRAWAAVTAGAPRVSNLGMFIQPDSLSASAAPSTAEAAQGAVTSTAVTAQAIANQPNLLAEQSPSHQADQPASTANISPLSTPNGAHAGTASAAPAAEPVSPKGPRPTESFTNGLPAFSLHSNSSLMATNVPEQQQQQYAHQSGLAQQQMQQQMQVQQSPHMFSNVPTAYGDMSIYPHLASQLVSRQAPYPPIPHQQIVREDQMNGSIFSQSAANSASHAASSNQPFSPLMTYHAAPSAFSPLQYPAIVTSSQFSPTSASSSSAAGLSGNVSLGTACATTVSMTPQRPPIAPAHGHAMAPTTTMMGTSVTPAVPVATFPLLLRSGTSMAPIAPASPLTPIGSANQHMLGSKNLLDEMFSRISLHGPPASIDRMPQQPTAAAAATAAAASTGIGGHRGQTSFAGNLSAPCTSAADAFLAGMCGPSGPTTNMPETSASSSAIKSTALPTSPRQHQQQLKLPRTAQSLVSNHDSGSVDWKAEYDQLAQETLRLRLENQMLRGELERRNADAERLGVLQGLLAMCE